MSQYFIEDELGSIQIPNFDQLENDDDDEESSRFELPNDTEDEGIENYKIGGYHPTFIG